jgi:hypothetical protein
MAPRQVRLKWIEKNEFDSWKIPGSEKEYIQLWGEEAQVGTAGPSIVVVIYEEDSDSAEGPYLLNSSFSMTKSGAERAAEQVKLWGGPSIRIVLPPKEEFRAAGGQTSVGEPWPRSKVQREAETRLMGQRCD